MTYYMIHLKILGIQSSMYLQVHSYFICIFGNNSIPDLIGHSQFVLRILYISIWYAQTKKITHCLSSVIIEISTAALEAFSSMSNPKPT